MYLGQEYIFKGPNALISDAYVYITKEAICDLQICYRRDYEIVEYITASSYYIPVCACVRVVELRPRLARKMMLGRMRQEPDN